MTANIILVSSLTFIVFVVVILGIYYFFSRKKYENVNNSILKKLHEALQVGKRVVCANGLYGTVKKVDEEKVDVEIAKGVVITGVSFCDF